MNFYNFQFNKMIILTNDATDSFIAFKKERKKERNLARSAMIAEEFFRTL